MQTDHTHCEKNTELAPYLFHQGTNFHAYRYLGVHRAEGGIRDTYVFRTWAPNATRIFVVGDFNHWCETDEMHRVTDRGIFELVYQTDKPIEGTCYKLRIYSDAGVHDKADPYAFASETLQNTASIIHTETAYAWTDSSWLRGRRAISEKAHFYSAPMNIYEIHAGSFITREGRANTEGDAYLNYRELAAELVPYLMQMGYTHVELLPIAEHPFDGSWGYQVCGYYAPTSRYGTPEDFKFFVNELHRHHIGVIMDWVPAHFPKDEHGLYEFDGRPLYEYQGRDRQESASWGTRFFDVGREEVQSFLVSNALFWLREYHIDGLRVDAVASMLYLDYDRSPGEWVPNAHGDNKNLEAIAFFQKLNSAVFGEFGDVLMIAEESTSWPMITKPVYQGGLGFNFKWNMGWANDMYAYLETDPLYRMYCHDKLTFSMMYAFDENYILPISHDEVVHGKRSLIDKCHGDYEQKFATDRTFFAYMMAHPGKKMTFMGCEYGQFREWDYENQLEWFMCDYPRHAQLRLMVGDLNRLYLQESCLWEDDFSWGGFRWIYPDRKEDNVSCFARRNLRGEELIAVFHFSPVMRANYEIPGLAPGEYELLLNTDDARYGGAGTPLSCTRLVGDDGVLRLTLPPLTALYFKKKFIDGRLI